MPLKKRHPHKMKQARNPSSNKVAGSSLVPSFVIGSSRSIVSKSWRYWVGLLPSAPVEAMTICGVSFPKMNEDLVSDPMRTSTKKRIPVIGAITIISESLLLKIIDQIPRIVFRFQPGQKEEIGTGQNIGDNHQRPRRGTIVTIPRPDELIARAAMGRSSQAYDQQSGDEPVAKYIFAILCQDQEVGERGDFYPSSLEASGFDLPPTVVMPSTTTQAQVAT